MSLAPGTRVSSYEILSFIGAGGMGEVYRARDTKLKRDVALKVLPDSVAQDTDRMARFQREAEVLGALNHPNIAAIYGVEERTLVMELVDGENPKGPLPLETVIHYASQIALALEAAHDKGIVHRDLKPANVKVTPSGVVKVLDFGLAAVAHGPPGADANPANSPTLTMRATEAGLIMGTAAYMSPEQAAGKPVDRRADVWSFGVVLWEMITGRQLFDGESTAHTLAAVLTKSPDLTELPSSTPANIRRLLHRCLDRDVKRRLRDIGDAWLELNTPDQSAPSQPKPRRSASLASRWLPWAIAGMVAAAAIAWGLFRRTAVEPRRVIRWSYTQEDPFGMPAISRDGSRMVYNEFMNGAIRLVFRALDQPEGRPIAGTENGGMAAFSPDGQSLAYFSGLSGQTIGVKLQKIDLTGGSPITLCDCPGGAGISWGDDGNIVSSDGKKLFRAPSSGGPAQPLTSPEASQQEVSHQYPFVLPGSRAVLFTINMQSDAAAAVLDLKGGKYRVLVKHATNPQYVSAGDLTFVRSGTLFAAPFDPKRLAIIGPEKPLIEGVGGIAGGNVSEYSVSNNGTLVYMAGRGQGGKSLMAWVDRNGVTQTLSQPEQWGNGRLSPDGRFIANSITTDGRTSDLWLFDTERRTPTRLTFGGGRNFNPAWTPDGRRIAYYSTGADKSGIYWIAADGSGKPELLATTDAAATPTSWSSDGKTLVFSQAGADKSQHLWLLHVSRGSTEQKPTLLHDNPFTEAGGQISPDGRYLAYMSSESGVTDIYVQSFPGPGAKIRISTQGGVSPRWSPNGRELLYWTLARSSLMGVDVETGASFHAGVPHQVLKIFSGTTWDIAPDGKKFLIEVFASGAILKMVTVLNWFNELARPER